MKFTTTFLLVLLMSNCNNPVKKQVANPKTQIESASKSNTLGFDTMVKSFETRYDGVVKELYDSVSKYQSDGIDFTDITHGLEQKYKASSVGLEKTLLGYKLAKNYLMHYESTNRISYKQKADSLFYSFIYFTNGELASQYLKLDIKKVNYLVKEWGKFSDQDKDTILFYGLLRGFNNGLPNFLKNSE
jgi:hypothetical protein